MIVPEISNWMMKYVANHCSLRVRLHHENQNVPATMYAIPASTKSTNLKGVNALGAYPAVAIAEAYDTTTTAIKPRSPVRKKLMTLRESVTELQSRQEG